MNISIFYCKFGSGHYRAARYLESQLQGVHNVTLIDVFKILAPQASELIYKNYANLIKTKPMTDYLAKVTERKPAYLKLIEQKAFAALDRMTMPDVMIASYSMAAYFLARYKKARRLHTPLVTCITDFNVHDFWVNEGCDLYLVVSNLTKQQLIERGVPAEKIVVYGLGKRLAPHLSLAYSSSAPAPAPVPASASAPALNAASADAAQDQPSRSPQRLHVLVSGGGLGLLPHNPRFYRNIVSNLNADVRVVCGKNRRLRTLLTLANIPHLTVYGYVDNMDEHLKWADCCIGKPGGLSVMEAIDAETPILYLTPSLPQERGNAQFIDKSGIGYPLTKSGAPARFLTRSDLDALKQNMHVIKSQSSNEDLIQWLSAVEA